LPVDLATNAESLGARVIRTKTVDEFRAGLAAAKDEPGTVVIAVEVDRYAGVPGYEGWWEVPVAEVSDVPAVQEARQRYEASKKLGRSHL
jgi:3D-(3,5/4)-trihydroxycyclohexane-1,2-dione acylhydrolase (decyclizing)